MSQPQRNYNKNLDNLQQKIISNECPYYEKVPGGYRESYQVIRCQSHLSDIEKLIYDELVYYYQKGEKTLTAFPKQKTLARKLGKSITSISRGLRKLEEHELIRIQQRPNISGKRREYVLLKYPLKIIDNYFCLLEAELKSADKEKIQEKKREQIERAKSKFEDRIYELASSIPEIGNSIYESESLKQILTQVKSSNSEPSAVPANSSINHSYLSVYTNHPGPRNVSDIRNVEKESENSNNPDDDPKNKKAKDDINQRTPEIEDSSRDKGTNSNTDSNTRDNVSSNKACAPHQGTSAVQSPYEQFWFKFAQIYKVKFDETLPKRIPSQEYPVLKKIFDEHTEAERIDGLQKFRQNGNELKHRKGYMKYVHKCIHTAIKPERQEREKPFDPAVEAAKLRFQGRKEKINGRK